MGGGNDSSQLGEVALELRSERWGRLVYGAMKGMPSVWQKMCAQKTGHSGVWGMVRESVPCSGWQEYRTPEQGNELDEGAWSQTGMGLEDHCWQPASDLTSHTSSVLRVELAQARAAWRNRIKPGMEAGKRSLKLCPAPKALESEIQESGSKELLRSTARSSKRRHP